MKRQWTIGMLMFMLMLGGCRDVTTSLGPQPRPTLLTDHLGQPQDLIPTSAEIAAAKLALDGQGFIGIVACNLSSEYHSAVPQAAEALAKQWDLPVQVFDSETKADRQNAAIETDFRLVDGDYILSDIRFNAFETNRDVTFFRGYAGVSIVGWREG